MHSDNEPAEIQEENAAVKYARDMNETVVQIIGWSIMILALLWIISTIIHIHRHIGLGTTRGISWLLAVIVGSLFGVVLYRFFRDQTESLYQRLFEDDWSA